MTAFSDSRYDTMKYRLCGRSGLKLPLISLGLWQYFGTTGSYDTQHELVHRAFDLGITHFDMANVYGPPTGEAERTFGKILRDGLATHRHELIISSKAGYRAWAGPYGDGGSKKNLITACEQSLQRTGLDYFDIFYHHRMDSEVPVAESMGALDQLVRQGKALYIGVSSITGERMSEASLAIDHKSLTPLTSLMSRFNLLQRQDELDKWPLAATHGIGGVAFSPLAQGLLSDKYLGETAAGAGLGAGRMANELKTAAVDSKIHLHIKQARALNELAKARGQTLAQMAIAWVLRQPGVASALIGASSASQIDQNVQALKRLDFTADELKQIDTIAPIAKNY